MKLQIMSVVFGLAALIAASNSAATVTIEYVTVGDPGNAADQDYGTGGPYGAVAKTYAIGKYEVTNAQYVDFLNAADPNGANVYSLYSPLMSSSARGGILNPGGANGAHYSVKAGYANMPVVHVSFLDAMRFTNWLHNNQGTGSTETGAYTIALGGLAARNVGATVWIPSEDEWYKAAYYHPNAAGGDLDNYWLYPMRTNAVPYSAVPPGMTPDDTRAGNFIRNDNTDNGYNDGYAVTGNSVFDDSKNYLTNAGAYTTAESYYGTFDQGGNVWEYTEGITGSDRVKRGGSYAQSEFSMRASSNRIGSSPTDEGGAIGFRVATIPEPTISINLLLGLALMAFRRKRF